MESKFKCKKLNHESTRRTDKQQGPGNSLGVQWLGLHVFTAESTGSIPGRGTKIPQAKRPKKKKKKKLWHIHAVKSYAAIKKKEAGLPWWRSG